MINIIESENLFNTLLPRHPGEMLMLAPLAIAEEEKFEGFNASVCRIRYIWVSEDYENVKILCKIGPNSWTDETQREAAEKMMRIFDRCISGEIYEEDPCYMIYTYKIGDVAFPTGDLARDVLRNTDNLAHEKFKNETNHVRIIENPFDIFKKRLQEIDDGTREIPESAKKMMEAIVKIAKPGEDINPN